MRSLLDVNVLLALMDEGHAHHQRVTAWWNASAEPSWASCPLTQNGFIRIISQASYPGRRSLGDAIALLRLQITHPRHALWPDDVSLLDPMRVNEHYVIGPRQLTDVHLLALAVRHGGRFVTLDAGISTAAVVDARDEHLLRL